MRPGTRRIIALGLSLTLHLMVAAGMAAWRPASSRRTVEPPRADRIKVFVVAREDSSNPGLNPIEKPADDPMIRRARRSSVLSLPGFAFDFTRIADRATLLFPFLTPGLSLEHFGVSQREGFRNPFAPEPRRRSDRPPLALSDAALQRLIDTSWSRRDRWTPFQRIIQLATAYSPDTGKLPVVVQAYLRQDGLQPYVDTDIRDPRLWTELGIAADHVQFIGFIRQYAADHPSTRTTTELLFLLDELVQGSLDALITLLDADPELDLRWTREGNADAYNLIVDIRRYYQTHLKRRGLTSTDALNAQYDRIRLAILRGILRTTPQGYRGSDARFLIGAIYWKQRDPLEALRTWRDITIDPTDYHVTAYSEILTAIRASSGLDLERRDDAPIDRALSAEVGRILRAERARWIMVSFDRLRQFGYHFDTF